MSGPQDAAPPSEARAPVRAPLRRIGLWGFIAATYFMVSGGAYGLEEVIAQAGYSGAVWVLALTPLLWSVPTSLMVLELSTSLPGEGGYYHWVRRALGPFWGFQEAWLSIAASAFDMAIYPTLFVLYLSKLVPLTSWQGNGVGLLIILACAGWNLLGGRAVSRASLWMLIPLLLPFACMLPALAAAPTISPAPASSIDWVAALPLAMWNYMGWDSSSTIAGEVSAPQRTYPVGIACALLLVVATYVVPVLCARASGLPAQSWSTGSWVDAGARLGGAPLAAAVALGGMVSSVGIFNALTMSFSRLPMALAQQGDLPQILARTDPRTGAPRLAILLSSVLYAFCLGLGFVRLVELDVVLYGLSLLLEFAALIVLRYREPALPRPFRIPGGIACMLCLAAAPAGLLGVAAFHAFAGPGHGQGVAVALGAVFSGPLIFAVSRRHSPHGRS